MYGVIRDFSGRLMVVRADDDGTADRLGEIDRPLQSLHPAE
jgi:hypothetical protein